MGGKHLRNGSTFAASRMTPSIKSSLTFLRKTPWARQKVEAWYLYDLRRERPRSGGA